jgi:pantetheine-phosphate adenylyltransferase
MNTAIFPGSFDPFTRGHENIVTRGCSFFDKIIIGIGQNSSKSRFFEQELMVQKIEETFRGNSKVIVKTYQGLTAKFAQENKAQFILRGLRNTTDFEYENSISQGNKTVIEDLETVFLITSPEYAYMSSSIARDLYKHGEDISSFIPYSI